MTRTPGETTTSTSRQPTREGGLRLADVLAAGLASAVAAIVGGLLGAVGSVISAFVVSAVSSIVLPLLRRPLRVGEDRLRRAPAGADEPHRGETTGSRQQREQGKPPPRVRRHTDAAASWSPSGQRSEHWSSLSARSSLSRL